MSFETTASVVQTRLDGDVLVVSINNPPVNALGAGGACWFAGSRRASRWPMRPCKPC